MNPADRIPASRDAMATAEPQQWHYTRRDPLDGIGLIRMALWVLILIPLLERATRLRSRK